MRIGTGRRMRESLRVGRNVATHPLTRRALLEASAPIAGVWAGREIGSLFVHEVEKEGIAPALVTLTAGHGPKSGDVYDVGSTSVGRTNPLREVDLNQELSRLVQHHLSQRVSLVHQLVTPGKVHYFDEYGKPKTEDLKADPSRHPTRIRAMNAMRDYSVRNHFLPVLVSFHFDFGKRGKRGIKIYAGDSPATPNPSLKTPSLELAESVRDSLKQNGLRMWEEEPIRHSIRGGETYFEISPASSMFHDRIMIEAGNLADPREVANLRRHDYLDKLAKAIAEGVFAHIQKRLKRDYVLVPRTA